MQAVAEVFISESWTERYCTKLLLQPTFFIYLQTIKRKVVEDKLKSLIRSKCFESQNTENEYYLLIADQQCKPLLKYSESLNTEQNDIARPSVQEKVK